MKKLLLLLCVAFSLSTNATVYLVQQGGATDPTWRAAVAGETLVNLTVAAKTLPGWYNANAATFVAGDQVWVIKGTYVFDVLLSNKLASIYGGFAGTETTITERVKPANARYWEFTNETIFDGNNTVQVVNGTSNALSTVYDGLTFTKMGGAIKLRGKETVQNCIFKNNTTVTSGAAVLMYKSAATVQNSYFYNNSATGTATGSGIGGAIYVLNAETAGTYPAGTINSIQNCVFDSNAATVNGAAIYIAGVVATVQNCLITGSTGGSFIYTQNASNFYNNTFVNNNGTAGLYISGTSTAVKIYNCVFWGGTGSGLGGATLANTASVELKNCAITGTPGNSTSWTVASNIPLDPANTGTDPLKYYPGFVDPTPATGNYKIATGSSLINAGMNITGMTTDFYGTTRPNGAAYDIGYHEFNPNTALNNTKIAGVDVYSANGKLHIKGLSINSDISIYDMTGKLQSQLNANSDVNIPVQNKLYIVRIQQGTTVISRVVVGK